MNGPVKLLLLAGLLAGVAGCHAPKHSNVLVFATDTKFAIDIGYQPTMQEPSLTVGYKRREGVWMPLLANLGEDGLTPGVCSCPCVKPCCQTKTPAEAAKCPAKTCVPAGHLYVGQDGQLTDTYSVLATFGAKWGAKGSSTNGAEAQGGLAQYFATGLAARKLADQGGAQLVSVQPASAVEARLQFQQQEKQNWEAGKTSGQKAKILIDKIATEAKYKDALTAGVATGMLEQDDAEALLVASANGKLDNGKKELKTFMKASSANRLAQLTNYITKLEEITK